MIFLPHYTFILIFFIRAENSKGGFQWAVWGKKQFVVTKVLQNHPNLVENIETFHVLRILVIISKFLTNFLT